MEPIIKNEIRIDLVYNIIKENFKKYVILGFSAALISSLLVICVPRYYTVKVLLAPEYGTSSSGLGALGNAASMFGINLGGMTSEDAIVPQFYPDLMGSTDFLVSVMGLQVETADGEFKGTLSQYVTQEVKYPWWGVIINKIKMAIKDEGEPMNTDADYRVNPYALSMAEYKVAEQVSSMIDCSVDSKTDVISLFATAQDPKVAAMLADGVKDLLQNFIIEYRTEKTKGDLVWSNRLCDEAYADYVQAQKNYAEYVDKHLGMSKKAYQVEEERLKAEMQFAYDMYNSLNQQRVLSTAKLQERTPAFTTLQSATIPLLPSGPKRMIIVFAFSLFSVLAYTVYLIARKNLNPGSEEVAEKQ